ncbi:hypothetical protein F8M41_016721 [Gigaspora margarita]|uniref:Uncharacterized protein n=1 Tax=Gigaspora margarita TaxID=4874 RepID=A0A8H3WSG8_GIGMA|nr:hypothetical protein F8M41_016721 [Gigaspora margarita]
MIYSVSRILKEKKEKEAKKQTKQTKGKSVPKVEGLPPDSSTGQAEESRASQPKLGTVIRQRLSDWKQEIKKANEFKDPKITDKFKYFRERLNQIENQFNYILSMTEEQMEESLKNAEKTLKIKIPKNTKTKRETVYKYLKGLADNNNRTIYEQKKKIKEIEKEYKRDTSAAVTINREQFERMLLWNQKNILSNLVQGVAPFQNKQLDKPL